MTNSEVLIDIEHVSRYYGTLCAVKDLSFSVKKGEVVGFLGPNGAGKSTTMQMVTGNLAPSLGAIRINGWDILDHPKEAKKELGYLPEQPPVYRDLSVQEYLEFCAQLNRIDKAQRRDAIARVLDRCGLGDVRKRLIGNLSKGYQQRIGIAQAIIHSPAVVILDEPTSGLDPIQIREIRKLIRELAHEHSVVLSTHILPEVQSTCNRVLIINNGEVVLTETTDGLNKRMKSSSFVVSFRRAPAINELNAIHGVHTIDDLGEGRYRVHHDPASSPAEEFVQFSVGNRCGLYELIPERMSLEEIFVNITCKEDHSHHEHAHEVAAT